MSLRGRFIVLVLGTTVIPLAVAALTYLVVRTGAQEPVAGARAARVWLTESLPELLARDDFDGIRRSAPNGLPMAVLPLDNRILAESLSNAEEGEPIPEELVRGAIPKAHGQIGAYWVPVRSTDGRLFAVAFRIGEEATVLSLAPRIAVIVLELSLLIFSGSMSIVVIRHLRNRMGALERATRRIAAGDYEFSVELEGSDELADLARAFEHMRSTIREDQQRSARFIMGISHDLKSPIGLIEGYAEAILDGHADSAEKLRHFAGIIKDRAGLLETRIRELIDLARLSTEDWQTQLSAHRIAPFLEELAGRYRADAGLFGHQLEARVDVAPSAWAAFDPQLIGRAIENLLTNSFRYAPPGSRVLLEATRVDQAPETDSKPAVRISVTNPTGQDFSAAEELLFEPFWRASSSRNEPGSGLGLSIARSIIASHGFHLSARVPEDKENGPALEMRIVIPLASD